MTFLTLVEVIVLLMGIHLVATGIHIQAVAPVQRRAAWWNFGAECLVLAIGVVSWMELRILAARGVNFVFTGWSLAVMILVLIALGIGSIS